MMRELASEGMTMVVVTHEIGFAREVGDQVVFMDEGVVIEQGDPKAVLDKPEAGAHQALPRAGAGALRCSQGGRHASPRAGLVRHERGRLTVSRGLGPRSPAELARGDGYDATRKVGAGSRIPLIAIGELQRMLTTLIRAAHIPASRDRRIEGLRPARRPVREGDTVLDVGANVGVAAAFFAGGCGAGVVHSFEPVLPIFEVLERNLARSRRASRTATGSAPAAGGRRSATTAELGDLGALRGSGGGAGNGAAGDAQPRPLRQDAEAQLEGRFETRAVECELRTVSEVLSESPSRMWIC